MSEHAIFLTAHSIELSPIWAQSEGADRRDLLNTFHLEYQAREGGQQHHHSGVYIVPEVQELIRQGQVKGFELETLWLNSPAFASLRGDATCVILSVRLADGTLRHCVPPEFIAARRRLLARAAMWFAVGTACAATPWPWFGGLVAGLATHMLRSALQVPHSHWEAGNPYPKLPLMTRLFGKIEYPTRPGDLPQ